MMKKNKCLLIDLPEDLFINNILLSSNPKVLLPIKSLLSLRCVCKYLRNLITSPAFIKMHLHHSTTTTSPHPPPNHPHQHSNQLVLIHSINAPYNDVLYFLKFNDGGTGDPCHHPEVVKFVSPIKSPQIWGSCNGLLCLSTKGVDDDRVCLWNPFTKEHKDLPPPLPLTQNINIPIGSRIRTRRSKVRKAYGFSLITYGFGYDRFIDDYKIIRCEDCFGRRPIIEFQVYTLGTNTWRKISSDNNPYKSYYYVTPLLDRNKSMVFVNGGLHWFMSKSLKWNQRTEAKVIVSFDVEKEVFREIQKPLMISKLDYDNFSKIQVLGGCLCLFDFNKSENMDCFNVWMMMDYGVKESWTKLFTIAQKEVPLSSNKELSGYRLLRFCKNGEILIGTYHIPFFYDPVNNKARHVEFGEIKKHLYQSESFEYGEICKPLYQSEICIESLVSLNTQVFRRGERRIQSKRVKEN